MCDHKGCKCHIFTMDCETPLNTPLSAYYKRSFAYYTIKERLPVILTRVIDHLVRDKANIAKNFGEASSEELKVVIGEISRFKYELVTNKPLQEFACLECKDTELYDQCLKEAESRYFTAPWLLVECYIYRRLQHIFQHSINLNKYDPFRWQKKEAFLGNLETIRAVLEQLAAGLKSNSGIISTWREFVMTSLWANKCDLTLIGGISVKETLEAKESNLLCDHSAQVWKWLERDNMTREVSFVLDNAGLELIADLALCDWLVSKAVVSRVILHLKCHPWYVSDVTISDLRWTIRHLINNQDDILKRTGIRWNKYLREKVWQLEEHPFWTSPLSFSSMSSDSPELYSMLANTRLIFLKGDLNYRKLLGDVMCLPDRPLNQGPPGEFHPSAWVTLRTLKADLVCGLKTGIAERINAQEKDWMVEGDYAVVQFSEVDNEEEQEVTTELQNSKINQKSNY